MLQILAAPISTFVPEALSNFILWTSSEESGWESTGLFGIYNGLFTWTVQHSMVTGWRSLCMVRWMRPKIRLHRHPPSCDVGLEEKRSEVQPRGRSPLSLRIPHLWMRWGCRESRAYKKFPHRVVEKCFLDLDMHHCGAAAFPQLPSFRAVSDCHASDRPTRPGPLHHANVTGLGLSSADQQSCWFVFSARPSLLGVWIPAES